MGNAPAITVVGARRVAWPWQARQRRPGPMFGCMMPLPHRSHGCSKPAAYG